MFNDIIILFSEREANASSIIPTVQVIHTMLVQAENPSLFLELGTTLNECQKSANERIQKYLNEYQKIKWNFNLRFSSSTKNLDFDFSKWFESFIKNKNALIENTSVSESMQETESKHYLKVKNEVLVYLSQDIIMQKGCPLAWWGENKSNFKQLAPIAQKYLSCPPSSVESEQLFSCGGQVYSSRRNRLAPETGEVLMFLHYNLRIHNF